MARAIDADTLDFSNCRVEIIGDTRFLSLRDVANVIKTAPTLTQPNEPLTLEQLREMDEPTPVWWKRAGLWCLCERGFIIAPNGSIYEFEETDGTFYRRPPEGEE